jgi:endonuclease/exonuclease/phosphatase family metal-dependent hydrolase
VRINPTPPPGGRLEILDVAERCGLALLYVPSARNGPDEPGQVPEDKGNAILSTLPLADLAAIELPFEAGRKVAVVATIPGPNGERIRVVSVHLDLASTLTRTLISGNATRLRQALGLAEALESMDSLATVVGGDFNTWSANESALKGLAVHFPDSPPWDGRPTRGPFSPDHILFRTVQGSQIDLVEESYRRFEETYGSDHAGRIVWLRG